MLGRVDRKKVFASWQTGEGWKCAVKLSHHCRNWHEDSRLVKKEEAEAGHSQDFDRRRI